MRGESSIPTRPRGPVGEDAEPPGYLSGGARPASRIPRQSALRPPQIRNFVPAQRGDWWVPRSLAPLRRKANDPMLRWTRYGRSPGKILSPAAKRRAGHMLKNTLGSPSDWRARRLGWPVPPTGRCRSRRPPADPAYFTDRPYRFTAFFLLWMGVRRDPRVVRLSGCGRVPDLGRALERSPANATGVHDWRIRRIDTSAVISTWRCRSGVEFVRNVPIVKIRNIL